MTGWAVPRQNFSDTEIETRRALPTARTKAIPSLYRSGRSPHGMGLADKGSRDFFRSIAEQEAPR